MESIIYVLLDCLLIFAIWTNVVKLDKRDYFFTSNIIEWVDTNLRLNFDISGDPLWAKLWATSCPELWIWRSKKQHDTNSLIKKTLVKRIWSLILELPT